MASNFRHLAGCEDGTGTFCCYGKSRRLRQIAHWPRSARTQAWARRCGLPDRRSSVKKLLSFVCLFVDVSFSSRINHRPGAACRVFKADVLRESKKIDMVPAQWDRRSKLAAVSHRSRTARQSSTWERGKIGRRRRIHTEKTKTITIIDTRIRTSRRVKVKSTFGGPPPIDNVCEDPVQVRVHAGSGSCHGTRAQLICWPSEGL